MRNDIEETANCDLFSLVALVSGTCDAVLSSTRSNAINVASASTAAGRGRCGLGGAINDLITRLIKINGARSFA